MKNLHELHDWHKRTQFSSKEIQVFNHLQSFFEIIFVCKSEQYKWFIQWKTIVMKLVKLVKSIVAIQCDSHIRSRLLWWSRSTYLQFLVRLPRSHVWIDISSYHSNHCCESVVACKFYVFVSVFLIFSILSESNSNAENNIEMNFVLVIK